MLAGEHVSVGHARHGRMGIALPAPIACGFHPHQTCVVTVLHVADKDAILDQYGATGRRALVVDRERAPSLRDGAVVDDGDTLRRDALSHQTGEGRSLLAVEVALEPVPHRLVQHDAGPAGSEHYVHLAGWRRHRFEVDQRLAHRIISRGLPGLRCEELGKILAPAITVAACFLTITFADDDRDIDAHQWAHVAIAFAVAA